MMKVKVFGNQDCVWYEIYAGLMSSMLRIWRRLKWVSRLGQSLGGREEERSEIGKRKREKSPNKNNTSPKHGHIPDNMGMLTHVSQNQVLN